MKNVNNNEKASIYLHVLRRWWWLPVLLGLVSGGVTYAGTRALLKPVYGASFTISIASSQGVTASDIVHDANWVATDISSSKVLNLVSSQYLRRPTAPKRTTGMSLSEYKHALASYKSGLAARLNIYLASRPPVRDMQALYRVSCVADITDHWVTCSTTSRFPASAAGVLTALSKLISPIWPMRPSRAIKGNYKVTPPESVQTTCR